MRRGDLLSIALQGDFGKPSPALVIQSDLFDLHPSLSVLPVTSDLRAAPLFRLDVAPSALNGLEKPSQVIVDKVQTVSRQKVGEVIGRLDDVTMVTVNRSLAVFLGIV